MTTNKAAVNKPSKVFWTFAVVMLLYGLGVNHLWASEDRWAEISREILLTGDWFHPAINGEVYFDKPLLSYWLIVILAKTFGVLNEFVTRLPSALSALLALYCTRYLGEKLWNAKIGNTAGWFLLGSMGFLFWGRTAAADMMNLTAVILAVSWFFYAKDRAKFRHYLLFWIICFCGALTKGLPALVIPPLLIVIYLYMANEWKKHLNPAHIIALVTGCILYASTFYIASATPMPEGFSSPDSGLSGLQLVWRENVIRVFQPFDHNDEPFFAYLYHMQRIMAPWSLLMIAAVIAMAMRWKRLSLNTRWLLIANAVIFLMFSFSGSRRWYYILPIMPFTALLMAEYIAGGVKFRWRTLTAHFYCRITAALCIVGIAGIAILPVLQNLSPDLVPKNIQPYFNDFLSLPLIICWALPLAALASLCVLATPRKRIYKYTGLPQRWGGTIVAGTILMAAGLVVVYPEAGQLRSEKTFALELKEKLAGVAPENIVLYPKIHPKIIFYMELESPVVVLGTPEELQDYMSQSVAPKYLISETRDRNLNDIANVLPSLPIAKPDFQESRVLFEKSSARKLRCWRIVPDKENKEK
jgi:4-amino-4-deoxy-L-arabinose transferase-like glycosyltransferase